MVVGAGGGAGSTFVSTGAGGVTSGRFRFRRFASVQPVPVRVQARSASQPQPPRARPALSSSSPRTAIATAAAATIAIPANSGTRDLLGAGIVTGRAPAEPESVVGALAVIVGAFNRLRARSHRRLGQAIDRADQLLGGLHALRGLLCEQALDERFDLRRNVGRQRRHRRRWNMNVRRQHVARTFADERRTTRAELEQDAAERVHIRARIDSHTAALLGRHVRRRSHHGSGPRLVGVAGVARELRDAEVEQLHALAARNFGVGDDGRCCPA
ncbi:MAG: hypothetical protein QM736_14560 [Vicinamibacterales bacterium]